MEQRCTRGRPGKAVLYVRTITRRNGNIWAGISQLEEGRKKKAVLKRYLTCRVLACHAGHVPAFGLGLPPALRGRHARVSPGSATSMVPALRAEGTREWGQPPAWGAAGEAPRPWRTKKAGMDAASTSPLIFLNERVAQLPPLPVQSQIPLRALRTAPRSSAAAQPPPRFS